MMTVMAMTTAMATTTATPAEAAATATTTAAFATNNGGGGSKLIGRTQLIVERGASDQDRVYLPTNAAGKSSLLRTGMLD